MRNSWRRGWKRTTFSILEQLPYILQGEDKDFMEKRQEKDKLICSFEMSWTAPYMSYAAPYMSYTAPYMSYAAPCMSYAASCMIYAAPYTV